MKKNIVIIIMILILCFFVYQKYISDNTLDQLQSKNVELEINIEDLETENTILLLKNEDVVSELTNLENKYTDLFNDNEKQKKEQLKMKYIFLKNNLPIYWNNTWDTIYNSEGILTSEQIEDINFLLQPVFYNEANPLSCFFTSYYIDIKNIDLNNFLRYCPYREMPEELLEIKDLVNHENWPFGDSKTSLELPVLIHKYKKEKIQNMFTLYADIKLDELNKVGFEDLIYLESTDSYYNFTSDFAPGLFNCTDGIVEDGTIILNGNNEILTIIKSNDKYIIKSFLEK